MDKSKPPSGWQINGSGVLPDWYEPRIAATNTLEAAWQVARENAQPFVDEAVEQIAAWLERDEELVYDAAIAMRIRRGDWKRKAGR